MADLPELNEWVAGIYQLETSDPVLGGPEGIDNRQAKELASRTKWLKDQIQKIVDGAISIGKASQLATPRTLKFKGAATGSGTYDGSTDTDIQLTLVNSVVKAGVYTKVEVNQKGLIVGGENPTKLADYGIIDALLIGRTTRQRPSLSAAAIGSGLAGGAIEIREAKENGSADPSFDYAPRILFHWSGLLVRALGMSSDGKLMWNGYEIWSAGNFDVSTKADKADSLAGYGIQRADQLAAEAGQDDTKAMTPLRVFQAIAKNVVLAKESVAGILKIATQSLVDGGVDDGTAVTPKKLRWGFQILKASNGYIIFPSWLGGWVVQWGRVGFPSAGSQTFNFTIPFPNAALIGVCALGDSVIYEWTSQPFCSLAITDSKTSAQALSRYLSSSSLQYIVVGH